jgi:hypothetical protein
MDHSTKEWVPLSVPVSITSVCMYPYMQKLFHPTEKLKQTKEPIVYSLDFWSAAMRIYIVNILFCVVLYNNTRWHGSSTMKELFSLSHLNLSLVFFLAISLFIFWHWWFNSCSTAILPYLGPKRKRKRLRGWREIRKRKEGYTTQHVCLVHFDFVESISGIALIYLRSIVLYYI